MTKCKHCGSTSSIHPVDVTFCGLYESLKSAIENGRSAISCVNAGNADGAFGASVSAAHSANLYLCQIDAFASEIEAES